MTYNGNIKTSINLINTTIHEADINGQAGRVGIIGSFPSTERGVKEYASLRELRLGYGIIAGTTLETEFEGARDAKRIFMEGIKGYPGASSVVCVNTSTLTTAEIQEFNKTSVNITVTDTGEPAGGELTQEQLKENYTGLTMTYAKLKEALNKIADDNIDMLIISNDLREAVDAKPVRIPKKDTTGQVIEGQYEYKYYGHTLEDVYELIIDFLDNAFSIQRPVYYIGAVQTDDINGVGAQPESGLPSNEINIFGSEIKPEKVYDVTQDSNGNITGVTGDGTADDKAKLTVPGARDICELFSRKSNELSAGALFYQGGSINGVKVGPAEMAAHMAGWIASIPVEQDLTYKTIPGVDGISEEVYFGVDDAGYVLNKEGINVLKPKNRRENTFYVNNSVVPAGWHLNHVRAVAYLLKRYKFEAGLGINNLADQLETFKSNLNVITKDVMDKVEIITEVLFDDDIQIIAPDHVQLGLNITVAGVVTRIDIGVNMEMEDYATTNYTSHGYMID